MQAEAVLTGTALGSLVVEDGHLEVVLMCEEPVQNGQLVLLKTDSDKVQNRSQYH